MKPLHILAPKDAPPADPPRSQGCALPMAGNPSAAAEPC